MRYSTQNLTTLWESVTNVETLIESSALDLSAPVLSALIDAKGLLEFAANHIHYHLSKD